MPPAIDIQQLGKQYQVRTTGSYLALRDVIAGAWKKRSRNEAFWALKDINLRIAPGERVGIIGRNGAGKSTLLKILSRVTYPTTGQVRIRGRLASLLEVGTGFHPELTGRENIFLNGAILGLKKTEIQRQFDAIVDFSGVEKFLDNPLKHFSSGMQLRLAFAVAAHLEPEVLLIDEVLAVGDLEFQRKCIGKMEEVSRQQGRTIVFVSHNMSYIQSLCDTTILLDQGTVQMTGRTKDVIEKYHSQSGIAGVSGMVSWDEHRPGNEIVQIASVSVIDESGKTGSSFNIQETVGLKMEYEVRDPGHVLWLGYNIHNSAGINVFDTHSVRTPEYRQAHAAGVYTATVWIPPNLLNTGKYYVSPAIFNHNEKVIHAHEHQVISFTIDETFNDTGSRGDSGGDFPGVIRPLLDWKIKRLSS